MSKCKTFFFTFVAEGITIRTVNVIGNRSGISASVAELVASVIIGMLMLGLGLNEFGRLLGLGGLDGGFVGSFAGIGLCGIGFDRLGIN